MSNALEAPWVTLEVNDVPLSLCNNLSYPMPEARGSGREELPHTRVRGSSREEHSHIQGAVAPWAQGGREGLLHV